MNDRRRVRHAIDFVLRIASAKDRGAGKEGEGAGKEREESQKTGGKEEKGTCITSMIDNAARDGGRGGGGGRGEFEKFAR